MHTFIGIALSVLLFLELGFAQGSLLCITKETESDANGAFAVDGLPPRVYQIEANAPGLYAAVAMEVSAPISSIAPVEMSSGCVHSRDLTAADTAQGDRLRL